MTKHTAQTKCGTFSFKETEILIIHPVKKGESHVDGLMLGYLIGDNEYSVVGRFDATGQFTEYKKPKVRKLGLKQVSILATPTPINPTPGNYQFSYGGRDWYGY